MDAIQLNFNTENLYQQIETNITVNKKTRRVRFELRYLFATEKWYLSMFDVQTGDSYFRYVPVINTRHDTNNLLAPFEYKDIGVAFCVTMLDETKSVSPKEDNLDEFLVVWGDEFV